MDSGSGFLSMEEPHLDPKWLIDSKLLFVGPRIGEGAHAKVYKGKYKNQNVAIKILHKGDTTEEIEKREGKFMREVSMLSKVQHKNLVKAYKCMVFIPPHGTLISAWVGAWAMPLD